jgi:hypothetical protein
MDRDRINNAQRASVFSMLCLHDATGVEIGAFLFDKHLDYQECDLVEHIKGDVEREFVVSHVTDVMTGSALIRYVTAIEHARPVEYPDAPEIDRSAVRPDV